MILLIAVSVQAILQEPFVPAPGVYRLKANFCQGPNCCVVPDTLAYYSQMGMLLKLGSCESLDSQWIVKLDTLFIHVRYAYMCLQIPFGRLELGQQLGIWTCPQAGQFRWRTQRLGNKVLISAANNGELLMSSDKQGRVVLDRSSTGFELIEIR